MELFLKPVFHSIIIDKDIMFLHSFAIKEICSTSLVVENVQLFTDGAKEQRIKFFGGEIFRQRPRNTRMENGLNCQ
jgi:hypothetical protein